jgi:hypothetical protein
MEVGNVEQALDKADRKTRGEAERTSKAIARVVCRTANGR